MSNKLIDAIKESEGFVGENYKDHLGFATIGYGSKLPLDEEEAEMLLKHRLSKKIDHLLQEKPIILTLSQERQLVLFEMAYNLGVNGLLRFKKMWAGIEKHDYKEAGNQMRRSRWYNQVTNRAERLAKIMEAQTPIIIT